MSWIITLLIGALAGYLAGNVMKGEGFGVIGNVVVGLIGAVIGGFVLGLIGFDADGWIGRTISAFVGAVILLWIVDKVKGGKSEG